MKKYKLIKTYPDSPKLGTIGYYNGGSLNFEYEDIIAFQCSSSGSFKGYFENNPENWKLVVEKDYEILSFSQNSLTKDLWIMGDKGGWQRNGTDTTLQSTFTMLNRTEMYHIHSIKRLSDGEVFQVNDNIKGGKIKSINIENDKIYLEV
jgi:hypothetical protein